MMILAGCLCIPAYAQEDRREDRVQVRGIAGWAGFYEDSSHRVAGVTTDIRLIAGLRVGPEVLYYAGGGQDRDITAMTVLTYDFRRSKRVTPFVSGGAGGLWHRDSRGWKNSMTFGAGAGVKFAISKRLFIAPEIRGGWEPLARASVSIGYRF